MKLDLEAIEVRAHEALDAGAGAYDVFGPSFVLELVKLLRASQAADVCRRAADEAGAAAAAVMADKLARVAADARRDYIRQHAPTILAGLAANANGRGSWNELRAEAKEQAGLLFDETRGT